LVGLAWPSITIFDEEPFFFELLDEGVVDGLFGIKLADDGGELFLGGANEALFAGPFHNLTLLAAVSKQALRYLQTRCANIYVGLLGG